MNSLKGHCATCRHWEGDKEGAMLLFKENPMSMDLHNGWPNEGDCGKSYLFLNLYITGNATVETAVDANFGCCHWEPDS